MSLPCLHLIAGARPNFMKIAPIVRALRADGRLDFRLVHTGQHVDREMNEVFFEELGLPPPDAHLGCGAGTPTEQTARIMLAYEAYLATHRPAACVVVGDVTSTLACALVARKAGVPVAHVEAGLRSGDLAMPEEINRRVVDAIADWFFVTEPSGRRHLEREGRPADAIVDVGHVMVDNLLRQAGQLAALDAAATRALPTDAVKAEALARAGRYVVVTLHRPSNVDSVAALRDVARVLGAVAAHAPVLFAVHPRTRAALDRHGIALHGDISLLGPQPYMAFLHLWKDAALVLTDSGGLQEETTALGVPCVTMRDTTERPVTIDEGTNVLAGTRPDDVIQAALAVLLRDERKTGRRPALWDGRAAERIVAALAQRLGV